MTLNLRVPESREVNPPSDDFVIDVIGRLACVGLIGEQRSERTCTYSGDRITGVVRAQDQPFANAITSRDIPTAYVDGCVQERIVDEYVVEEASILGIELQFSLAILPVKLVRPVRFGDGRVGKV